MQASRSQESRIEIIKHRRELFEDQIIDYIRSHSDALTISSVEIAELLGVHQTHAARLLKSMVKNGKLMREKVGSKYKRRRGGHGLGYHYSVIRSTTYDFIGQEPRHKKPRTPDFRSDATPIGFSRGPIDRQPDTGSSVSGMQKNAKPTGAKLSIRHQRRKQDELQIINYIQSQPKGQPIPASRFEELLGMGQRPVQVKLRSMVGRGIIKRELVNGALKQGYRYTVISQSAALLDANLDVRHRKQKLHELRIINYIQSQPKGHPIPASEIAELLSVSQATADVKLRSMVRRGLLQRQLIDNLRSRGYRYTVISSATGDSLARRELEVLNLPDSL